MSEKEKIGRQNGVTDKTQFHMWIETELYDFLIRRTKKVYKSVAAQLNDLVRELRQKESS